MRFFWIALIAVSAGANAQAVHKCVGKDGKTSYSADPCQGSKEIAPARKVAPASPAGTGAYGIPGMQAGKWKLRFTKDGRTKDEEICGNPLDGFRQEVQAYAANAKDGCTMATTPSGPRNVTIVHNCPTDRTPDGRSVQKGRSEMSLVSASPQAFRLQTKSNLYASYVMDGVRIGDCKQ